MPTFSVNKWKLVSVSLGVITVVSAILFFSGGWSEDMIRAQIRWSAKISFTFFCFAFAASGIHHVFSSSFSEWLLKNRKYLGISFALIHLIHLGWIVLLQLSYHPVFNNADIMSLAGGGLAYFFVVLLLLTSFDTVKRRISDKIWKRLHLIGCAWILIVFSSSYLNRIDEPIYWVNLLMIVLVLAARFSKTISFS